MNLRHSLVATGVVGALAAPSAALASQRVGDLAAGTGVVRS
jgi:hypothetical protein